MKLQPIVFIYSFLDMAPMKKFRIWKIQANALSQQFRSLQLAEHFCLIFKARKLLKSSNVLLGIEPEKCGLLGGSLNLLSVIKVAKLFQISIQGVRPNVNKEKIKFKNMEFFFKSRENK